MGEREVKTFWMTKYALSGGIQEVRGEIHIADERYATIRMPGSQFPSGYKIGTDVFYTEAEAISNAEERRKLKILSLKKQIAKLEKLKFEGAW